MPDVLVYGDTEHSAALRHEVPLRIIDPFLYIEREGRKIVLTNALERNRIAATVPDAELVDMGELGLFDLIKEGMSREDALLTVVVRAVHEAGVERALVPPELPVELADRLRGDGVELLVHRGTFADRRRAKSPAELEGIRRAQRAAEAGMRAGADMLRAALPRDGRLVLDGEVLTAERVRAAIREACALHGAPAPPDIMVVSALSGGGHDSGSGPLPADLPIEIDLWPCDEVTGCWADMTRTFVVGAVSDEVAGLRDVVRESLEAARAAVRPGVTGRELYDLAADVIEQAGHPTQRARKSGDPPLTTGFYFSLGHGVGLDVHEPPGLGLATGEPLVAGDVIAMEPGIEGIPGIGGVRYEDLMLVTEDGFETLTDYRYDLAP